MAKEIAGQIKLQIKGGAANPSPPVGPALGSKGINTWETKRPRSVFLIAASSTSFTFVSLPEMARSTYHF